jgi:hypothetical protein
MIISPLVVTITAWKVSGAMISNTEVSAIDWEKRRPGDWEKKRHRIDII